MSGFAWSRWGPPLLLLALLGGTTRAFAQGYETAEDESAGTQVEDADGRQRAGNAWAPKRSEPQTTRYYDCIHTGFSGVKVSCATDIARALESLRDAPPRVRLDRIATLRRLLPAGHNDPEPHVWLARAFHGLDAPHEALLELDRAEAALSRRPAQTRQTWQEVIDIHRREIGAPATVPGRWGFALAGLGAFGVLFVGHRRHRRSGFAEAGVALLALAGLAGLLFTGCSKTTQAPTKPEVVLDAAACSGPPGWTVGTAVPERPRRSSSIALSPDERTLFAVNTETDTLSVIDVERAKLVGEVLLAGSRPKYEHGCYDPSVGPMRVSVSPDGRTAWVTGPRNGMLLAVGAAGTVERRIPVGVEPLAVLAHPDGQRVFVTDPARDTLVVVDAATGTVARELSFEGHPRELALSVDGQTLYVGLTKPAAVAFVDTASWTVRTFVLKNRGRHEGLLVDGAPPEHRTPERTAGLSVKPDTGEVWVAYALADVTRRQPQLDFRHTVHPGIAILDGTTGVERQFSQPFDNRSRPLGPLPVSMGAGSEAIDFGRRGEEALVLDRASEDIVGVSPKSIVPLWMHRPGVGDDWRGMVLSSRDRIYVDAALSGEVVVNRVARTAADEAFPTNCADERCVPPAPGPVETDMERRRLQTSRLVARVSRLCEDPMPARLRLGSKVFHSANQHKYPVTTGFWMSCELCHHDSRTDGLTWQFEGGPRQTPSLAGGTAGTGRLLWTGGRTTLLHLDRTFNAEMGGTVDASSPEHARLLDALAGYIEEAIPPARHPSTGDAEQVRRGQAVFARADVGCIGCHVGPAFTDSPSGALHDVGTCATDDIRHVVDDGTWREACAFDTPRLSGVFATAPYLHDGSARTLRDVVTTRNPKDQHGQTSKLSSAELDDLVAYLRSL